MDKIKKIDNSEKPSFSKEERISYLKIAIQEAVKQGDESLANHYRLLLNLVEKVDNSSAMDFILNSNKK